MNHISKHTRRAGIAALSLIASVVSATPAVASTIDFETLAPAAYTSGVTLTEAGFNMNLIEGPVGAFYGAVSGTGTVVNGASDFSCDVASCPVGATGNYLAILNDGAVGFSTVRNIPGFKLSSFDLAFIAPRDVASDLYGRLVLSGELRDGTVATTSIEFPGQNADNEFVFGAGQVGADFRALTFTKLTFSACLYDMDFNCFNSFDNPAGNQAQFALDNVNLSEVPEPASFLLAGLGLGALGLARRRTRPAAATV